MSAHSVFPILRESFLFRDSERVFLTQRHALRLDDSHKRFLESSIRGGETIEEILNSIPEEGFPRGTRPPPEKLIQRLEQPDSYLQPVSYRGRNAFDAIVVFFERAGAKLPPLVLDLLSAAPASRSTLLVTSSPLPRPVRGVQQLVFEERKTSPIGTPYRFLQFARSLIRSLPPSRVFVPNIYDAIPLIGALSKHRYGICMVTNFSPFLVSAPLIQADLRIDHTRAYEAILYWLRTKKQHEPLSQVVRDCREASVAGLKILGEASDLFVACPTFHGVLDRRARTVRAERHAMVTEEIRAFVFPSTSRRRDRGRALPARRSPRLRQVQVERNRSASGRSHYLVACPLGLEDLLACQPSLEVLRQDNPSLVLTFLARDCPESRILEAFPQVDRVAYVEIQRLGAEACEAIPRLDYYQRPFAFRHVFDGTKARQMPEVEGGWSLAEAYAARLGFSLKPRVMALRWRERARPRGQSSLESARNAPYAVLGSCPRSLARSAVGSGWSRRCWRQLAGRVRRELDTTVIFLDSLAGAPLGGKGVHSAHNLPPSELLQTIRGARFVVTDSPGLATLAEHTRVPSLLLQGARAEKRAFPPGDRPSLSITCRYPTLSPERVFDALLSAGRVRKESRRGAS
jgi:ADP-heptose:LPS heptosyltransferase